LHTLSSLCILTYYYYFVLTKDDLLLIYLLSHNENLYLQHTTLSSMYFFLHCCCSVCLSLSLSRARSSYLFLFVQEREEYNAWINFLRRVCSSFLRLRTFFVFLFFFILSIFLFFSTFCNRQMKRQRIHTSVSRTQLTIFRPGFFFSLSFSHSIIRLCLLFFLYCISKQQHVNVVSSLLLYITPNVCSLSLFLPLLVWCFFFS
jgi:hypothetical protein